MILKGTHGMPGTYLEGSMKPLAARSSNIDKVIPLNKAS